MNERRISLPNNWAPRAYQREAWNAIKDGAKKLCIVAHRRWGKDEIALHGAACLAHDRIGNYWHMLPQANQAKKAIWKAVNPHTGKQRIDEAFPRDIRSATNNTEMLIEFGAGSTWQVVGSDNYNSLVGSPPVGLVFSEWALADPMSYAFLSPILAENDGVAIFIYTPRGRNHGRSLYERAKASDDWFCLKQSVDDTGIISQAVLDEDLKTKVELFGQEIGQAMWEQEWHCSFDAAMIGSYYGHLMRRAEQEGRVGRVPWEPRVPVRTYWDLGKGDHMAIWFVQMVGKEIRVIDFESGTGVGIPDYAKRLMAKPYTYEKHGVPHDARVTELGTQFTRVETMMTCGLRNVQLVPDIGVDDGINAVRMVLPRCWFNQTDDTQFGIDALWAYRAEYDEEDRTLKPTPKADWAAHPADAFRYMAVDYADETQLTPPRVENAGEVRLPRLTARSSGRRARI